MEEEPKKRQAMIAEKVTLTELVHKVTLGIMPYLEELRERIMNLEILLTTKDKIEEEQMKILIESNLKIIKERMGIK